MTEPGKDSPYPNRSVEENLSLFERMRAGEFPDGSRTLRAKVDMGSPNLNMRDPVMYRILHAEHHRTGNKWPIYPTTTSHTGNLIRWSRSPIPFARSSSRTMSAVQLVYPTVRYFPFAANQFDRLNLTYTILSKRKLLQLVEEGHVTGWQSPHVHAFGDPARGYTPEAIRNFWAAIGVSKTNGSIELAMLEHLFAKT